MNKIFVLFFVLSFSSDLFSQITQYNSGNSAIAPLPLYTPDFNQMSRSLNQADANYELQLNQMRARYNAMTPEERQAYLEQLKVKQEAEKESEKINRKMQTILYAVGGVVILLVTILKR